MSNRPTLVVSKVTDPGVFASSPQVALSRAHAASQTETVAFERISDFLERIVDALPPALQPECDFWQDVIEVQTSRAIDVQADLKAWFQPALEEEDSEVPERREPGNPGS